jgi:hypothetical protein
MKTELLFAVASVMLIGAVLVFAFPTPVQADKKTEWCTESSVSLPECFNAKGQCDKFMKAHQIPGDEYGPCQEQPA